MSEMLVTEHRFENWGRATLARFRNQEAPKPQVTLRPDLLASSAETVIQVAGRSIKAEPAEQIFINRDTAVTHRQLEGGNSFYAVYGTTSNSYRAQITVDGETHFLSPVAGKDSSRYEIQTLALASVENCGTRRVATEIQVPESTLAQARRNAEAFRLNPANSDFVRTALINGAIDPSRIMDVQFYVTPTALAAGAIADIGIAMAVANNGLRVSGITDTMFYYTGHQEVSNLYEGKGPDDALDTFIGSNEAVLASTTFHADLAMLVMENGLGSHTGYSEIGGKHGSILRRALGFSLFHELQHVVGGRHPVQFDLTPGINHGFQTATEGCALSLGVTRRQVLSGSNGLASSSARMKDYVWQRAPIIAAYGGPSPAAAFTNTISLPWVVK